MSNGRGLGNRAPSSFFPLIKHEAIQEAMMKVRLNVDYAVYVDGIHPAAFKAGDEVDLPERIASVLIGDKRAALAQEEKMESKPPENKMEGGVPANKMAKTAPANKDKKPKVK